MTFINTLLLLHILFPLNKKYFFQYIHFRAVLYEQKRIMVYTEVHLGKD